MKYKSHIATGDLDVPIEGPASPRIEATVPPKQKKLSKKQITSKVAAPEGLPSRTDNGVCRPNALINSPPKPKGKRIANITISAALTPESPRQRSTAEVVRRDAAPLARSRSCGISQRERKPSAFSLSLSQGSHSPSTLNYIHECTTPRQNSFLHRITTPPTIAKEEVSPQSAQRRSRPVLNRCGISPLHSSKNVEPDKPSTFSLKKPEVAETPLRHGQHRFVSSSPNPSNRPSLLRYPTPTNSKVTKKQRSNTPGGAGSLQQRRHFEDWVDTPPEVVKPFQRSNQFSLRKDSSTLQSPSHAAQLTTESFSVTSELNSNSCEGDQLIASETEGQSLAKSTDLEMPSSALPKVSDEFLHQGRLAIFDVSLSNSNTTVYGVASRRSVSDTTAASLAASPRIERMSSHATLRNSFSCGGATRSRASSPSITSSASRFKVVTGVNSLPRSSRESPTRPLASPSMTNGVGSCFNDLPSSSALWGLGSACRQDYLDLVTRHISQYYFSASTEQDIGRVAALQPTPPEALCLRAMTVDANTVATLLSYNSRNPISDLLFDDCVFATIDCTWCKRLTDLTALRFKGKSVASTTVQRLLANAPTVRALSFINCTSIASLAYLLHTSSQVQSLQLIQTDITDAAYDGMVHCSSLHQLMLMNVPLHRNISDLLSTNHVTHLQLVGCQNLYYNERSFATTREPKASPENSATKRASSFPLRSLLVADCPGIEMGAIPFEEFQYLAEISVMYQPGLMAADLQKVLLHCPLETVRLQQLFVDGELVKLLKQCQHLRELNLSFCRGMQGLWELWPLVAHSLHLLNISYSDIEDEELLGLHQCEELAEVYARGCKQLRDFSLFRLLAKSVLVIDVAECSGMESRSFDGPFNCTELQQLVLDGCSKLRYLSAVKELEHLRVLSLARSAVTDDSLQMLLEAPSPVTNSMEVLDLSNCTSLNAFTSFAPSSALAFLTTVNLSRSSINDTGVLRLARTAAQFRLRMLDLSFCEMVTDASPLGAVRSLKELDLSFTGVRDGGLAAYANQKQRLRILKLNGCTSICDVGALGSLPCLCELHLSGSTVDGSKSFEALSQCTTLTVVDISECMHLRSAAVLVSRLSQLRILNLSLSNISGDTVTAMKGLLLLEELQLSGCPRVETVDPLGSLPVLQRLNLSASAVEEVEALSECPLLWDVSVAKCIHLKSIAPLAAIKSLRRLDASQTNVGEESFLQPWQCTSLEELDLHGCTQVSSIPFGTFRSLARLRKVNCRDSSLNDSGLAAFGESGGLEALQLSGSNITTFLPLQNLSQLQSVIASKVSVADAGVAGLTDCHMLATLDLSGCEKLCDISSIRRMRNLTSLRLCGSTVADATFAEGWPTSVLRQLDISGCHRICCPAQLPTLTSLAVLNAADSGLTDEGLERVAACPSLQRLSIEQCHGVKSLEALRGAPALTHLDASEAAVERLHRGWDVWTAPFLRHMSLRNCAKLSDVSALRTLCKLRTLDVSNSGITAESFSADSWSSCAALEEVKATHCAALLEARGLWEAPRLSRLSLACSGISKIEDTAEGCAALEVLDLSHCEQLSNIAALRDLPRLQQLKACGSAINDGSFRGVKWTCELLREVDLSKCSQIHDASSLGALPRLRSANFSESGFSDEGLRGLSESLSLESVDLSGCPRIVHAGYISRLPSIRRINLTGTAAGNFSLMSISRCTDLEELEMEECPFLSNVFVVFEFGEMRRLKLPPLARIVGSVLHSCVNLEQLSLRGCPSSFQVDSFAPLQRLRALDLRESQIGTAVLRALHNCNALEELEISYCSNLTHFEDLGALPRLRVLAAAGLPVEDDVCDTIAKYSSLQKLILAECSKLRNVSALRSLPHLHHLDLSESGVTEASFQGIRELRSLEELSLRCCHFIRSFHALVEVPAREAESVIRLPRLRFVEFSGTSITVSTAEDTAALRRQCPLLSKIYLDASQQRRFVRRGTSSFADSFWKNVLADSP